MCILKFDVLVIKCLPFILHRMVLNALASPATLTKYYVSFKMITAGVKRLYVVRETRILSAAPKTGSLCIAVSYICSKDRFLLC